MDITPINDLVPETERVTPIRSSRHVSCDYQFSKRGTWQSATLWIEVHVYDSIDVSTRIFKESREIGKGVWDLGNDSPPVGDESFWKSKNDSIVGGMVGLRDDNLFIKVTLEIHDDDTDASDIYPKALAIAKNTLSSVPMS
ncbi:MAG: hypothetical protein ACRDT4_16020 [Micromonosporaceae bacterium]